MTLEQAEERIRNKLFATRWMNSIVVDRVMEIVMPVLSDMYNHVHAEPTPNYHAEDKKEIQVISIA